VRPTTGETVWYLSTGLSKPFFAELLATSAREIGAGRARSIVLAPDDAGWHGPEGLAVPDGIRPAFLPPHGPELQPAGRLWALVDERRSSIGMSPASPSSTPASPRAAAGSTPPPSGRTPASVGGPSQPIRTDHQELV